MRRVVLLLFLSLCLPLSAWLSPLVAEAAPGSPQGGGTFSCLGQTTGHCYAWVEETPSHQSPSGTNFWGVRTAVDLVPMYSANGFVTNQLWLADSHTPTLCHPLFFLSGACWIELGYKMDVRYRNLGTHLFWADVRPLGLGCGLSCGYNEHQGPSFPISTYLGLHQVSLSISYAGSGNWQVRGGVYGGSTLWVQVSTNNFMQPDSFEMGQELYGSGVSGSAAYAPKADFRITQEQTVTGPTWNYITDSGTPSWWPPNFLPVNPPWGGWDRNQSPPLIGNGGLWYTCTKASTGSNPC